MDAIVDERKTEAKASIDFFLLRSNWHEKAVRLMVGLVMLVIYFWLAAGVIHLGILLYSTIDTSWTKPAKTMITEVVTMLAALELIRTLQSYLQIGRVRVTFILDAVPVNSIFVPGTDLFKIFVKHHILHFSHGNFSLNL